jgi:hypothetical protein
MNAFVRADMAVEMRAIERARKGVRWQGPKRVGRESLLKERVVEPVVRVSEKVMPGMVGECLMKDLRAEGKPRVEERKVVVFGNASAQPDYVREPREQVPVPLPWDGSTGVRFVRWWPGCKPEEAIPVY